jgi:hypothetical protein
MRVKRTVVFHIALVNLLGCWILCESQEFKLKPLNDPIWNLARCSWIFPNLE